MDISSNPIYSVTILRDGSLEILFRDQTYTIVPKERVVIQDVEKN
jgi:hypothetical protein